MVRRILQSLGLSTAFVLGYCFILPLLLTPFVWLDLFRNTGRDAYAMLMTPMDLPVVVYRNFNPSAPNDPSRVLSGERISPILWFLGGNIIIYSIPAYLILKFRKRMKHRSRM